jgi:hypothetical protein
MTIIERVTGVIACLLFVAYLIVVHGPRRAGAIIDVLIEGP